MKQYKMMPLSENVEEMFIGPFGSSLKNDCFVPLDESYCMVYEQKHAIQKTMNIETRYVDEKKYNELKRFTVQGGDIIVSCRGTIGETFVVPENAPFGIMHPSIMKIRLKPGVYNIDYFNKLLYTRLKNHANEANGSGIKMAISATALGKELFPVPTIQEQQEIADTLDKLQSIITHRKQQLEKLDELVKARFVEMFGDPIDNPRGWQIKPLKELSTLITNGNTPKGGSENYVDSGIIFLRSQNVWRNRIDLSDVAYIDEATNQKMRKSIVKHKDILITKTGRINTENSSLGRAALYLGEDDSANINGHVYLVRLRDTVIPEFAVTILTGEAYRKYIRKVCVGGIDKRQINLDQVEDFPIIMPPLEQQKGFAVFSNQINKSKVAVQKSLDEAQLLFDSLMQEYFGQNGV